MTSKAIVISVVAVIVIVGLVILSQYDISMRNPWLDGQIDKAELGDLVIPVTATGTVEPANIIQIKSKASGQVTRIHVVEGQMVRAGDVLVELDPIDERRTVEARQAEVDRATSAHEKAKIALRNYQQDLPLLTALAKARLDDATARYEDAAFRWDKMKGYIEGQAAGQVEAVTTKSNWLASMAARDLAAVEYQRARNNEEILLKSATEDLKQSEAILRQAQKQLDEAQTRLDETTVRTTSDGMVYSITIREGEMIQSGTMSLMGGTQLMILADTSAMFVMAQVDEADIGAIREIAPEYARPGLTEKLDEADYQERAKKIVSEMLDESVEVTVDAYRWETYHGVIERILPEPIRVSGAVAFRVRVRLVGSDLEKLMGLQADLSFTTKKKTGLVLVKNEALHSEGRNCFVYVPAEGRPREEKKIPVEIGITDGTFTEIKSGLKPGDPVFTRRPQKTEKEKSESSKK